MAFLESLKKLSQPVFPSARSKESEIVSDEKNIQNEEITEKREQDLITADLKPTNGEKFESDDEANPIGEPQHTVYSKFTGDDIEAILPSLGNDEDMPAATLRMWILAVGFGTVVAGADAFFGMRFPSVSISVVVILVVTWPLGCLLHTILPAWEIKLWKLGSFNLNPGPFNYKEHGCIFIFTNVVTSAGLVNNLAIEDIKFFEVNSGIGRQILFNMSCYIYSFALIGLFRDILVTPEDRIWPGMLSRIALFKAIYSKDNPVANGWKMSRWVFLIIVFLSSFVWYWVPDLLMPFTSTIGAWITWIKPESATLSQVFGVKTGLGIFPLTFDWTQITSINNPLTTPFWAVATMFASFVFWIWIVMPGLYYQNHYNTAHFPIMTNKVFTVEKEQYSFRKVVDKHWKLDLEKYRQYSPPMLPIAFLMNLCLNIAVFTSLMTHFILLFPEEVIKPWRERSRHPDRFNRAVKNFKSFPIWIYFVFGVIGLGLGFAFTEGWDNSPLDAGGFAGAVLIGTILYIPLSLLEARANSNISISAFFYIVSANWYEGQPLKLLYFYSFAQGIIQHAMHMAQGAKIGHYLRIKPKTYMTVLFFSGVWAACVSPSVTGYLLYHIRGICTEKAENNMVCRSQSTAFNTQGIWGLFGSHIFAPGGRYGWVLWFFLVGGLLSAVHFVLLKWRGRNSLVAKFDPVLFFGGAENIPSVTGYNYSTWFFTALIFNYFVHRKYTAWWRKYNLVSSIGMDCGVAITIIIVYFAIVYTGASKHFHWWGTEVGKTGCDATGCPHLNGPVPRPRSLF